MPALRRLIIGYKALGKRRWLVARDSDCFVVWRPGVGRMLQLRLPLNSRFTTENRAQLIALARQWRNSVVLLGPGGNA